jgi:hypothetical protein
MNNVITTEFIPLSHASWDNRNTYATMHGKPDKYKNCPCTVSDECIACNKKLKGLKEITWIKTNCESPVSTFLYFPYCSLGCTIARRL